MSSITFSVFKLRNIYTLLPLTLYRVNLSPINFVTPFPKIRFRVSCFWEEKNSQVIKILPPVLVYPRIPTVALSSPRAPETSCTFCPYISDSVLFLLFINLISCCSIIFPYLLIYFRPHYGNKGFGNDHTRKITWTCYSADGDFCS